MWLCPGLKYWFVKKCNVKIYVVMLKRQPQLGHYVQEEEEDV